MSADTVAIICDDASHPDDTPTICTWVWSRQAKAWQTTDGANLETFDARVNMRCRRCGVTVPARMDKLTPILDLAREHRLDRLPLRGLRYALAPRAAR